MLRTGPFFVFLFLKISFSNKQKQEKKKKEGLGPSKVALWATSPDPETIKKTEKNKKKQKKQTNKEKQKQEQQHPTTKQHKANKQKQNQHQKESKNKKHKNNQTFQTQMNKNKPPHETPKTGKNKHFETLLQLYQTTNTITLKPEKNKPKKHHLSMFKNNPLCFIIFCFFQHTVFDFEKLCFAENTIKIVFSETQLFKNTVSKTHFFTHVKKTPFSKKGVFFGFGQFPLKPLFL